MKVKILKKELADFCRRYHVQKLALFGSVLGEGFRADSDVDVLVSFQPNAKMTPLQKRLDRFYPNYPPQNGKTLM